MSPSKTALPQEKTANKREFERLYWEEISLHDFVLEFWSEIEPGKPFVDGKHIVALCQHLEAVLDGRIQRLIVNMPPRHAKSTIISVLFRVWSWIKHPQLKWLCASYALSLATRDNVKCRRLILSLKFQERYGHIFKLTKDQNAKIKFENDKSGSSQAVSVGSSSTGEGFDVGLIDDPHSIDETRSDVTREGTLEWFRDTWCTRLNDQRTSAMIVVGQRVHEQDLSGFILSGETGEHWVHLNLATEFEPENKCRTYLPNGKLFWEDWRELEGELLWPERFPREVIEKAKRRHGPLAYAALYGQNPASATGTTFNQKNERLCSQSMDAYFLHTPRGIKAVKKEDCVHFLSVDPAISEEQSADYMVIGLFAKTEMKDLLLLHITRGRWGHHDQQDEVQDAFKDSQYPVDFAAVETVAYQHALFQDLVAKGIPCRPFKPHKDKVARASVASIWQGNGKIYFLKDAEWLPDFQKELYKFPKTRHDDQVDALSLASIVVRSQGPLSDETNDEEIPEAAEESGDLIPLTVPLKATPQEQQEALQVASIEKPIDPFQWTEDHYGGDW